MYEAILYLFQFPNKNGGFPVFLTCHCTCTGSTGQEMKSAQAYEIMHAHSESTKGRKIFLLKA